jgi:hypothetical protein
MNAPKIKKENGNTDEKKEKRSKGLLLFLLVKNCMIFLGMLIKAVCIDFYHLFLDLFLHEPLFRVIVIVLISLGIFMVLHRIWEKYLKK